MNNCNSGPVTFVTYTLLWRDNNCFATASLWKEQGFRQLQIKTKGVSSLPLRLPAPPRRTMMLHKGMLCSFGLHRMCRLAPLCRTVCNHLPLWLVRANTLQIFHTGWVLSLLPRGSGEPELRRSGCREAQHNHKHSFRGGVCNGLCSLCNFLSIYIRAAVYLGLQAT